MKGEEERVRAFRKPDRAFEVALRTFCGIAVDGSGSHVIAAAEPCSVVQLLHLTQQSNRPKKPKGEHHD
jgi:hypothetical protein